MTILMLKPCENCGVEYKSGLGWQHPSTCVDYDPPRELNFDDLIDFFGDEDPTKYI
jgi:hypothetical protein